MNILTIIYWLLAIFVCGIIGLLMGIFSGWFFTKFGNFMVKSKAKHALKSGKMLIPFDERDLEDKEKWGDIINLEDEKQRFNKWEAIYPEKPN